jgi:hypothetical protein
VQHPAHMVRMVHDPEPLADYFGHPPARPQVSAKASGQRTGTNNICQLLPLRERELRRPSPIGFSREDYQAASGDCAFPTLDARQVSTDESRDLRVTLAIL